MTLVTFAATEAANMMGFVNAAEWGRRWEFVHDFDIEPDFD